MGNNRSKTTERPSPSRDTITIESSNVKEQYDEAPNIKLSMNPKPSTATSERGFETGTYCQVFLEEYVFQKLIIYGFILFSLAIFMVLIYQNGPRI